MSEQARRLAGAIAGALVAGTGITAMLIAGERSSGKPSELVDLGRQTARRVGVKAPGSDMLPTPAEQAAIQGGHLALSAIAGAAYATAFDRNKRALVSGIGFGLAFYAAAHWIVGPLLGLKAPEWRAGGKTIGMHTLNHLGFGIATALGARAASSI